MKNNNTNRCPICNNPVFCNVATCTDHFTTLEEFSIEKCTVCDFIRTKDAPTAKDIGRYYQSESYISHSETSKGVINRIYHIVKKIMLSRKARLVKKSAKLDMGRILDYGTGTGMFIQEMQRKGWHTVGIEKSKEARDFASARHNIHLFEHPQKCDDEDQRFDVITLWHVMEHIEELDELWKTIDNSLTKNGTLIIALPNCASYDAKHYKGEWAAYDVPRHLWHFTESTFRKLSVNKGYKITAIKRMPFDGFYISMLSEQNRKSKLAVARGVIHGLWGLVLSLFDKKESSSLIYILKRSGQ